MTPIAIYDRFPMKTPPLTPLHGGAFVDAPAHTPAPPPPDPVVGSHPPPPLHESNASALRLQAKHLAADKALAARIRKELGRLRDNTGQSPLSAVFASHVGADNIRRTVAIDEDAERNGLSMMKVAIARAAVALLKKGKLHPDAEHVVKREEERYGTVVEALKEGDRVNVYELLRRMLANSDNAATDILINRVGRTYINTFLKDCRYTHTRLLNPTSVPLTAIWEKIDERYRNGVAPEDYARTPPPEEALTPALMLEIEADRKKWLGHLSMREACEMLEEINADAENTPASVHARKLIEIMKAQYFRDRLRSGLEDEELADKPGEWPPTANGDMGIIYPTNGRKPVYIAVLINQVRIHYDQAADIQGRIATHVMDAWVRGDAKAEP